MYARQIGDWEVRGATARDIEAILALRGEGAAQAFRAACDMPEILNTLVRERTNRSQLIDELQKADCFVLVAVDGAGRIVGTAQLDVDADAGSLSACAVAEGGRGIGSALMQARLEIARSLGLTTAWLETDTVNPEGMAHAVRHGLTPVCRRPGRLIPGNVVVRFERQL